MGFEHANGVAAAQDGGEVVGFVHVLDQNGEVGHALVQHRTQPLETTGKDGHGASFSVPEGMGCRSRSHPDALRGGFSHRFPAPLQKDGGVAFFAMKRTWFALSLMLLSAMPVSARPYTVYDYDPAYLDQPYRRAPRHSQARSNRDVYVNNQDTNSCVEGSVIGGLLGAGIGAALSRGNGRWVGVPVGGAAGALLGCQVDGG
jgi:hypothetical protein